MKENNRENVIQVEMSGNTLRKGYSALFCLGVFALTVSAPWNNSFQIFCKALATLSFRLLLREQTYRHSRGRRGWEQLREKH